MFWHDRLLLQRGFITYLCSMQRVFGFDDIRATAEWLLQHIDGSEVLAFHGQMGAGKTTLIHTLCELMGVKDHVTSPTFSIINEYKAGDAIIYHLDLYRLKDVDEAVSAGVEDCLYSGKLCLVEWPDIAASLMPPGTLHIYLEVVDTNTRSISFS